ncbi:metabolite traffic protein EboE [Leeuwenhoekiella sp. A16]|uniref:metabolite traffic protein EboE n=1 Tax=unclassified Leeuwenhoekiella TaxID=2615029 RepID=UPI003A802B56
MLVNNKFHLTYCTNVHPGENWDLTFKSLKEYVPGIKNSLTEDKFGLGLRLSNKASEELGTGDVLNGFKKWLDDNDIYVFTMNGFPYGNFHNERVKDLVHAPDWTTDERVIYTKRLADQLAILLPNDLDGGISTSPISYRHWHKTEDATNNAFEKGAENLSQLIVHLHELEERTGKYIHLDIEPEPDGMLENSDEFLQFFSDYLLPIAIDHLKQELGSDSRKAKELIYRYITICYDVCHFSLAYEEPKETLQKLAENGVKVGKIQVSSALKILFNKGDNEEIWETLAQFNEPVYLHQVTQLIDGNVKTFNDLPDILAKKADFEELRAHFHVPLFLEKYGALYSTQDHILKVIAYLKDHAVTNHLEVETYTWDVLPAELKTDLGESITRELGWLTEKL